MSFLPGAYNLQIYQNATYILPLIWSTGNCACMGTVGVSASPVDLTGYTATMQFRAYAPGGTLYFDASSEIVLGGVSGTITLTIPDTVTATFSWPSAVYDLILTSSSNVAVALLSGAVTVTPGVST